MYIVSSKIINRDTSVDPSDLSAPLAERIISFEWCGGAACDVKAKVLSVMFIFQDISEILSNFSLPPLPFSGKYRLQSPPSPRIPILGTKM